LAVTNLQSADAFGLAASTPNDAPIQTDDSMFANSMMGVQTPGNEFMSPMATIQSSAPSSAVNTNPTPGSNQGSYPSSPFATNDTSKPTAINPWGFPKKDDYEAPAFTYENNFEN
jgi:hypothetical protein